MNSNKKKWLILWLVLIGLVFISLGISIWSLVLSRASLDGFQLEFSYDALGTIIGIILSAVALVISLYFVILGIGANSVRREIKEDAKDARESVERIKKDADKLISETIEDIKKNADDIINNTLQGISNKADEQAKQAVAGVRGGAANEVNKAIESIRKDAGCIRDEIEKDSKENRIAIIEIIDELYSEVIAKTQEFYNSISSEENKQKEPLIKLKLNQCRHACDPKNFDFEDDNRVKEIIMKGINLIPDLSSDKNDLKLLVEVMNKSNDQDIKGAAQFAIIRLNKKLHSDS